MIGRNKRQSEPLGSGEKAALKSSLAKLVALRVDLDKLDGSEQHELAELLRKARPDGQPEGQVHPDLDALSRRDRNRFERLVEQAAGVERGLFERERSAAKQQKEMAELIARARRQTRQRYEEPGAVIIPREFIESLADGITNWSDHAITFLYALAQLEGGQAFALGARLEDDALVIPQHGTGLHPPGGDPESVLTGWRHALPHLQTNGWLAVEKRSNETWIRLGDRYLRHVEKRGAKVAS